MNNHKLIFCSLFLGLLSLQSSLKAEEKLIINQSKTNEILNLIVSFPKTSINYEYEKQSYPYFMAQVLLGDATGCEQLTQLDPQAEDTLGIDLYSGFVLKNQMRKYFAFQQCFTPEYKERMKQAFKLVTTQDPVTVIREKPRKFWLRSKDDCQTLVDCRNTENLKAMRQTSVYLMAEEVGNETVRLIYQQEIQNYVNKLYTLGMGEWDSPIYHGHTTAAYLNLYDFAQNPQVKQLAKQALDFFFTSAAYKYWQGKWVCPCTRPDGDDAAKFFWYYFADAPIPAKPEPDWIIALTSNYQPPEAAIKFAHREFNKPLRVERTHPDYHQNEIIWHEVIWYGANCQLGYLQERNDVYMQDFDLVCF